MKEKNNKAQSPFEESMNIEMQPNQVKLYRILDIIGGLSEAMTERIDEAKKLLKEHKGQ
jgi:hypothetical protein